MSKKKKKIFLINSENDMPIAHGWAIPIIIRMAMACGRGFLFFTYGTYIMPFLGEKILGWRVWAGENIMGRGLM